MQKKKKMSRDSFYFFTNQTKINKRHEEKEKNLIYLQIYQKAKKVLRIINQLVKLNKMLK